MTLVRCVGNRLKWGPGWQFRDQGITVVIKAKTDGGLYQVVAEGLEKK